MRGIPLILLVAILTGSAGFAICTAFGADPHARQLLLAGGICSGAAIFAIVPLLFVRGASQAGVSQTALVGTMIHLFATMFLIGVLYAMGIRLDKPLCAWLLAFYWMTLAALVLIFVRAIQAAPSGAALRQ